MPHIRNIKELADLAGVSTGTVSRALADSPLISARTRERIQAIAREHAFRPNALARNLRIQRTGAIGVLVPLGHEQNQSMADPFFSTMLGHLADALARRDYDLLLSRVIPHDDGWLDRHADSGRVDGLIVIGQSDQWEVLERVAAAYRPLVVWGAHKPGQVHCAVGTDNVTGGRIATEHLIAQGCERIAFFGDPHPIEFAQRLDGCRAALAAAGMAPPQVVSTHLVADDAIPGIEQFFREAPERPHGIVCTSDVIGMCALRVAAEAGIAVPGEMRVVGFDGLSLGELTVPRLTSVRQDIAGGARLLVDLLMRRIAGDDTRPVTMTPELVVRMSS